MLAVPNPQLNYVRSATRKVHAHRRQLENIAGAPALSPLPSLSLLPPYIIYLQGGAMTRDFTLINSLFLLLNMTYEGVGYPPPPSRPPPPVARVFTSSLRQNISRKETFLYLLYTRQTRRHHQLVNIYFIFAYCNFSTIETLQSSSVYFPPGSIFEEGESWRRRGFATAVLHSYVYLLSVSLSLSPSLCLFLSELPLFPCRPAWSPRSS